MPLFLELKPAAGEPARLALLPGLQRIKVAVGDQFRIIDDSGATPGGIVVKRLDNHLIVDGLPDGVEVELTEFYARCGVSSPCSLDLLSADAGVVSITPATEPVRALTDGAFVLYPANPATDHVAGSGDTHTDGVSNGWLFGGLALGALAVAGAAGGGSGKGDGEPLLGTTPTGSTPVGATPVDNAPPAQPKLTSARIVATDMPVLEGEAEADSRLTVSLDTDLDGNADRIYQTIADAAGRWRVDLSTDAPLGDGEAADGLPDGTTSVTVVATDASANASEATRFDLLIDTRAPGAPRIVSVWDDVPARVGTVANGATTNDLSPTLTGTLAQPLAPGERIEILRDGNTIATVATGGGTAWSFTDGGLDFGRTYSYSALTVDSLGNESNRSNTWRIVTDDKTNKTATITGVTDNVPQKVGAVGNGGTTNDKTPTLSGKLSAALESGEMLQVFRDGQLTALKPAIVGTAFTVTDTALADGAHAYTVRVSDSEGNGAMSAQWSVVVDTANSKTAAIVSVVDSVSPGIGTIPKGGATNDTTPSLNGTISTRLAAGEVVEILRDDVVVRTLTTVTGTTWTWTDSGLANGETYVYSARVVDAAGNEGATGSPYAIRVSPTSKALDDGSTDPSALAIGASDPAAGLALGEPLSADSLFATADSPVQMLSIGMPSSDPFWIAAPLERLIESA